MNYHYANNESYAHLSAGTVIKSYKGNTNFPVRLGHEIFNRCIQYCSKQTDFTLYDPMCGSGYLLTTIGYLNRSKISHLYGSDINPKTLAIAKVNTALLTRNGAIHRKNEIQKNLDTYQRPSYLTALGFATDFIDNCKKEIFSTITQNDFFDARFEQIPNVDITIMDIPYDRLVGFEGGFSNEKFLISIDTLTQKAEVLAIIRERSTKIAFDDRTERLEKFKVGKRIVEILRRSSHIHPS